MKKLSASNYISLVYILFLITIFFNDCGKSENPVKFPHGIFPDTVVNLVGLNSAFDDYNTSGYQLNGALPLIFSSNRRTSGGQFDLEQGLITFSFDQTDGTFILNTGMTEDPFMNKLIDAAETTLNDFGPYRIFSAYDGFEYFIVSSENSDGNLDLFYCKNLPSYGSTLPDIDGPHSVTLLNTGYDDAYLSFDLNLDTAYFTSNIEGNFDIYLKARPVGKNVAEWFNQDYGISEKIDSINSSSDDECPIVYNKFMVFTSNRAGGNGGYDLYYSVFRKGNWSSPVNFGPKINSANDEFRPLIGNYSDFTNIYMIFSSDRPGGKGDFDLYFVGIEVPDK